MASLESRFKKKEKEKRTKGEEREEKRRQREGNKERENVRGIEQQPSGGGEARLIEKYGGEVMASWP